MGGWREDALVELYQPDDDRTWKIQIMRANEDGTIEPTDDKPQTAGLSIPALGTIV